MHSSSSRRNDKGKSRDDSGSYPTYNDLGEGGHTPPFDPTPEDTEEDGWSEYSWTAVHNCWVAHRISSTHEWEYRYDVNTPYNDNGYYGGVSQSNQHMSYQSHSDHTGSSPPYTAQESSPNYDSAAPYDHGNTENSQTHSDHTSSSPTYTTQESSPNYDSAAPHDHRNIRNSQTHFPALPEPITPGCQCGLKKKLCGILIGPHEPKPQSVKKRENRPSSSRARGKEGSSKPPTKLHTEVVTPWCGIRSF